MIRPGAMRSLRQADEDAHERRPDSHLVDPCIDPECRQCAGIVNRDLTPASRKSRTFAHDAGAKSGRDRHAERPDSYQLEDMIDEARALLDDIELGVLDRNATEIAGKPVRGALTLAELLKRSRQRPKDGYPEQSLGGGGGPSTVLDDEGKPMAPLSDPVGELATTTTIYDPVRAAAAVALRGLTKSIEQLRSATSAIAKAEPPSPFAEPVCRSCQRLGRAEVPHRGELCRWCYDFNAIYKQDPPLTILRDYHDGKRITQQMIAAALPAPVKKQKGRARRRRA